MADIISSLSSGATSQYMSKSCVSTSAVGSGLFGTSLKCSTHRASSSVVSILACLSVIDAPMDPWYLPLTS